MLIYVEWVHQAICRGSGRQTGVADTLGFFFFVCVCAYMQFLNLTTLVIRRDRKGVFFVSRRAGVVLDWSV